MKSSASDSIFGYAVWLGIGAVWLFFGWNSQTVLAFRYNVSSSQVHIENKSHDCDFLRAPLGDKECSYEREITVINTGTDASGHHFVSYDEGKTWSPIDNPAQVQTGVFVTWHKKPDAN